MVGGCGGDLDDIARNAASEAACSTSGSVHAQREERVRGLGRGRAAVLEASAQRMGGTGREAGTCPAPSTSGPRLQHRWQPALAGQQRLSLFELGYRNRSSLALPGISQRLGDQAFRYKLLNRPGGQFRSAEAGWFVSDDRGLLQSSPRTWTEALTAALHQRPHRACHRPAGAGSGDTGGGATAGFRLNRHGRSKFDRRQHKDQLAGAPSRKSAHACIMRTRSSQYSARSYAPRMPLSSVPWDSCFSA